MNPRRRGDVYFANLGERIGRKRVLVVSFEGINRGLRQPICALITAKDRPRSVQTYVELEPPEGGVKRTSFVLCHYLITLHEGVMDEDPEGRLSAFKMIEVQDALKRALNLN